MEPNQNRTDFNALETIADAIRRYHNDPDDDVYFLIDLITHEVEQTGRDVN